MILFVDDEPFLLRYYIDSLTEAYGDSKGVVLLETLEDAQKALRDNPDQIEIIILDIMMPPATGWDASEVEFGLTSGLKFLEENIRFLRDYNIAVLILTNRNPNKIKRELDTIGREIPHLEVRQKLDTPHFMLPQIINRLVGWLQ